MHRLGETMENLKYGKPCFIDQEPGYSAMDDSISTFCKTLNFFCRQLQSSCSGLKEALLRRPIPLESASSTFIQSLNRRILAASSDLNVLESMAFGTVSFEELLGHCNELYKKNQGDLAELDDHLKTSGYEPDFEMEDEDLELGTPATVGSKFLSPINSLNRTPYSSELSYAKKRFDEDSLFQDSLSLENIGLSDEGLATLASEATDDFACPHMWFQHPMCHDNGTPFEKTVLDQHPAEVFSTAGVQHCSTTSLGAATAVMTVSENDYQKLPSHIKNLASWEDLRVAVVKLNAALSKQEQSKDGYCINQDELALMGLGPKWKSYLLLLLRLNRLVLKTFDDSIAYCVVAEDTFT